MTELEIILSIALVVICGGLSYVAYKIADPNFFR